MTIYKDCRAEACCNESNIMISAEHNEGGRTVGTIRNSADDVSAYAPTKGFRGVEDRSEYAELIEVCRLKGTDSRVFEEDTMRRMSRVLRNENISAEENAEASVFGSMEKSRGKDGGVSSSALLVRKRNSDDAERASFARVMMLLGSVLIISGAATGAIAWRDTAEAVSGTDVPSVLSADLIAAPTNITDSVIQVFRSAAPFFAAIMFGAFFPLGGIMTGAALFLFGMGMGFNACCSVAAAADIRCWLLLSVYALFAVFSLLMLAKDSCASANELFRHGYAEGSKKGRLRFFVRCAAYALLLAAGGVLRGCVALL